MDRLNRRAFLQWSGLGLAAVTLTGCPERLEYGRRGRRPNIVFVFADQWRAQATGYTGDPNARTPNLDTLERGSINFTHAVSGCPVCSPYRASLLTGQYPLTHGVFLNDVPLAAEAVTIAEVCRAAGYRTGYIGKWHLEGNGRSRYIPADRRQGFDYWKVLECTHNYNRSQYYAGDDPTPRFWPGYDAIAQTDDACRYIREHASGGPFLLMLSWGPPHAPYLTAPEDYRKRFRPEEIVLRENVPAGREASARRDLAGYYAHIAVLDDCVGRIVETLEAAEIAEETIFVFTSDHGDMLYSQGMTKKQKPYDESIRVPFLLRYPAAHGEAGRRIDMPINTPDIMPTLLGLCEIAIPKTVEGRDYSGVIRGTAKAETEAALIMCPSPFGQWDRRHGGREYRGVRTRRYTYVRDMKGPWLLFDNEADPYQRVNLVGQAEYADVQARLEGMLTELLRQRGDAFLPGPEYIRRWGWTVDENGTVPYWLKNAKG